jgi:uncharacterized protein (DUF736 family)
MTMTDRQYENLNGRGQLFRNDLKSADTDPDYRGELRVDDMDYTIRAWIREAKTGRKYMSLSLRPKQADADDRTGLVPTL